MSDSYKESGGETARGERTVPGGRYTNHVDTVLAETERKAAVYDLQRERSELYLAIVEAAQHDSQRQILSTLYFNDGVCDYNDLDDWVNRHRSTIKKQVGKLNKTGVVNRSGNPAFVSFPDTDVALLIEDVLNLTD